jgi:hypothetical protein
LTPIAVTSLETVEHFAPARARLDHVYGVHDVIEGVIEVFKASIDKIELGGCSQQNHEARIDAGHRRTRAHGSTIFRRSVVKPALGAGGTASTKPASSPLLIKRKRRDIWRIASLEYQPTANRLGKRQAPRFLRWGVCHW